MTSEVGRTLDFLQVTQLVNGRVGLSPGSLTQSPLQYGAGKNTLTLKGSSFQHVVKSHGLAKSLLFILKQALKVSFTAIPLFCTKQETIGTKSKMRPYGEVGITQAPISIPNCREEDASSSHGADCYARSLHRIMDPSAIYSSDCQPITRS